MLESWSLRAGIRSAISSAFSTASSGWRPMARKAGRRPWTSAKRPTAFIFTAELPGLTREQVRIDVHDGRLTLHGRREARVSCEQYHQVERGHGEFCRTFVLPQAVDADASPPISPTACSPLPCRSCRPSAPPRRRFMKRCSAMFKSCP